MQRDDGETFAPGFGFSAQGVRIGNPDWAKRKQFAELEAVDAEIRLLPLLWHRLDIPSVRVVRPSIDIEQRKDGSNTWTFAPSDEESSAWTVDIGEIAFDAGEVWLTDAVRDLDLRAEITQLDEPIPFGQHVDGDDPSTRREVIHRVGRPAAERLRKAVEERAARAERARPHAGRRRHRIASRGRRAARCTAKRSPGTGASAACLRSRIRNPFRSARTSASARPTSR